MAAGSGVRVILPGAEPSAFVDIVATDTASAVRGHFAAHQQLLADLKRGGLGIAVPEATDQTVWLYEHFRILMSQLNDLIGRLGEAGACNPTCCPTMKCGQFEYRCAGHQGEPRDCPALSYMAHTVETSIANLSNTKTFASRVRLLPEAAEAFPNLSRRLYRCLVHAWYAHKPVFAEFEAETHCAARFAALARAYRLLGEDQIAIPDADVRLVAGGTALLPPLAPVAGDAAAAGGGVVADVGGSAGPAGSVAAGAAASSAAPVSVSSA